MSGGICGLLAMVEARFRRSGVAAYGGIYYRGDRLCEIGVDEEQRPDLWDVVARACAFCVCRN